MWTRAGEWLDLDLVMVMVMAMAILMDDGVKLSTPAVGNYRPRLGERAHDKRSLILRAPLQQSVAVDRRSPVSPPDKDA